MKRKIFNKLVEERNFRELFTHYLGWNSPDETSDKISVKAPRLDLSYECVAEKSGVPVLLAKAYNMPNAQDIKIIDIALRRHFDDYITICFLTDNPTHQMWVIGTRSTGKQNVVAYEYKSASEADNVFSRLDAIDMTSSTETDAATIRKAISRAFDINLNKAVREFYNELRKEHQKLVEQITGIDDEKPDSDNNTKQSYAWLMINRLLLCYYIQKAGIIDDNTDYLHDKLVWQVRAKAKNQNIATFYRVFLKRLFSLFCNPDVNREFEALFGRVPYVGVDMFSEHVIERQHPDIDIADDGFVSLFKFLDSWSWYTYKRTSSSGRDINHDMIDLVLLQNTLEYESIECDSVPYESTVTTVRNAIITYVLDRLSQKSRYSREMFASGGWVWQLFCDNIKRYVDNSHIEETLSKVNNGQLSVRDLAANYVNLHLFIADLIAQCESEATISNIKKILNSLTVLDPNCGDGTYLMAASEVIESLEYCCQLRLYELAHHLYLVCNDLYSIRNYVLTQNIYGADINKVAAELTRLRLFVRLIAGINPDIHDPKVQNPLPIHEIKVCWGNLLVGYASEDEIRQDLRTATDIFQDLANKEFKGRVMTNLLKVSASYRSLQIKSLSHCSLSDEVQQAKIELRERLANLDKILNNFIFSSTGYLPSEYQYWYSSQKPLNWIAAFYHVMHDRHGFDIIVGNSITGEYNRRDSKPGKAMYGVSKNLLPQDCGNLYTLAMIRCKALSAPNGLIKIKKTTSRKPRK